jgi:nucleotide sugar dehydrogenase
MYVKRNIGVVGAGFVGEHVLRFFRSMHSIKFHDTVPAQSQAFLSGVYAYAPLDELAAWADFIFVCVPTPSVEDGHCDVSIVEQVISDLNKLGTSAIIIIKSTVAVGTTEHLCATYPDLKIVFSPEFASMSKYWSPHGIDHDMIEAPYYIFGGEQQYCSKVIDLFIQVGGPTKKYLQTRNPSEAEMVKYVTNTFYTAKIVFCNEMKKLCDALKLDWHTVRELWLNDPRVNPMHTAVFAQNEAARGKCFPKDLLALIKIGDDADCPLEILKAVRAVNEQLYQNQLKKEEQ